MSGTFERSQVGKREDLKDIISNVDGRMTPILSSAKTGDKPHNTIQSWQVDAYNTANPDNAVVDGADVESFSDMAANRKRVYNRIQKFWKNPKVSDMAENVSDVAGLGQKREMAAAIAKAIVELRRDMEAAIGSDNESQEDTGTVGHKCRGLGVWIQNGAQSDLAVDPAFRTPTTSLTTATVDDDSLTEDNVQSQLQSIWDETGDTGAMRLFCGGNLKRRYTDFGMYVENVTGTTVSRQMNQAGDDKRLVSTIDAFQGDFGTVQITPDQFLAYDGNGATSGTPYRGYYMDMDLFKIAYTRRPNFRRLEDQGGGPRGIVDAIATWCVTNPLGFGKHSSTS